MKVKFTRKAVKDLKKLDKPLRPQSKGSPLKGNFKGMWRYRLGKLRILVRIKEEEDLLEIHRIIWRKDAYKNP